MSLWPSVVVGKCSHKYQGFFHGYITLKKKKKVFLAGLPWLQLLADLVQEEVGFLDTLSFLLLAALSKVQVGLVAADAAVRRPSVGLSAASSRPDGGDCGRTTVCCGAGSPPPLHPDGRDCTEKSCAANTDRARVGGRWPRHLTPSACAAAAHHPQSETHPAVQV